MVVFTWLALVLTALLQLRLSNSLSEWTWQKRTKPLSSITQDAASQIVKRSAQATSGSQITLNFKDGMRDFVINGKGISMPEQAKTQVAFQATLTSGQIGPSYTLGAIKFNDISLNVGNAYSPSTGKFTAPVDGVYQLSVSYLQQNGFSSHVRMMKGNTVFQDMHSNHKNYQQISKTVLVSLKKNETFWARLVNNSAYAVHGSSRYTTFGGHLVY